jgi:hypothetical protein
VFLLDDHSLLFSRLVRWPSHVGRSPQQKELVGSSRGLLSPFICMFSCACVVHGGCRCISPLVVALARSACLFFCFLAGLSSRTLIMHTNTSPHLHPCQVVRGWEGLLLIITVPFGNLADERLCIRFALCHGHARNNWFVVSVVALGPCLVVTR